MTDLPDTRTTSIGVHDAGPSLAPEPSAVTPDEFKAAFRDHPAGVSVITADAGTGPVALTATSVFSVSVVPPLLVFSVSELSSSAPVIRAAETVVVHLLGADQLDLAKLGATSGIDRFADTSIWRRLETGEPYFPAARTWIRGRVVSRTDAGASTVIAVEALQTRTRPVDESPRTPPLVYHDRTWHHLGEHSRLD
jgi:flavin reductase (DIM6/NTAB) family NADH-FMN oxidoreductase RutF